MKRIIVILLGLAFAMTANTDSQQGIIGRIYEDGAPVIYRFVNELPDDAVRKDLIWLTVISWKYEGSSNNGMPLNDDNQRMMTLEAAIDGLAEIDGGVRHAYSRTGNNLKELVYYVNDQDQFMGALNGTLNGHPRYPIEITFYNDAEWEDFKTLLRDFSKAGGN